MFETTSLCDNVRKILFNIHFSVLQLVTIFKIGQNETTWNAMGVLMTVFTRAHMIDVLGMIGRGDFSLCPMIHERTGALPYQDSTWQPAGLIWKLSQSLGPRPRNHLVSILPALSNETWPALEKKWIMGPSINTIFSPFEVAYVIESGKMSCVKVITQFLRTNLLCLMFLTFEDCCGFIYSDSSQTDRFFSLCPNVRTIFNLPSTLYNPCRDILAGSGRGGCVTG